MTGKTLLVEAKSGRVLQVLNNIKNLEVMPEVITYTQRESDGPFFPVKDVDGSHKSGDVVELDFLLVRGDIHLGVRVVRIGESVPTMIEPYTLIAGIKGRHKIGDIIEL